MPANYTGNAANITSLPLVIASYVDGDAGNAAIFNPPITRNADMGQYLMEQAVAAAVKNWFASTLSSGITPGAIGAYEDTGGGARFAALVGNTGNHFISGTAGMSFGAAVTTGAQDYLVVRGLNGIFLAGGNSGILGTSAAGASPLTARTSNTTNNIHDFAWNGNVGAPVYVGVTALGDTIRSTDGTTWVKTAVGGGVTFQGIAYGGGKFVAVRADRHVYTSTDGTSWTDAGTVLPASFTPCISSVRYSSSLGRFVVAGTNTTIRFCWSDNGTTWTEVNTGVTAPGTPDHRLVWNGRYFFSLTLAAVSAPRGIYSLDGKTWTFTGILNTPLATVGGGSAFSYGSVLYLAARQDGAILLASSVNANIQIASSV